ncbi:MAG TPA: beta-ketoacyl-[acyl-carrier-protein] synthase family protein [Spirochaetia bacterium]|nr:beta-ketoacyl-[acyl-carrier-protein] synthase family protein [Spirochaetia bacterium]
MRRTEEYCRDQYQKKQSRLRDINRHDPGDSALVMADLLGTGNIATTINTACSSSLNSIILGARMIRQGLCEAALAGGTDCLCLFTLNGFNSLMILDKNGCRPFDSTRQGLTLGEGAGFVVLESEDHAAKRRKIPLCRLSGWGNTCDAHHMTASSPEGDGAVASMNEALAMSSLKPEQIDYINAHGTGTPNNDLSEGRALEKVFTKVPPVSSTKAVTGHTLGASGGIETVLCILSILHGHIYPNLRYTSPMAELSFKPALSMLSGQKIHHVLTNSFGFGGSNSTLVLSAI